MNLFKDFNKQINHYKQLFGSDSRKITKKLTDILTDTKSMFLVDTEKKRNTNNNEGILRKCFKSIFTGLNEFVFVFYEINYLLLFCFIIKAEKDTNYRLSHLNSKEIDNLMKLIDGCLDILNGIYQFKTQDESPISSSQTTNEDLNLYEASNDGLTLKLSPRGRKQVI